MKLNHGKISIENAMKKFLRKLKTCTRVVKCASRVFLNLQSLETRNIFGSMCLSLLMQQS